MAIYNRLKLFFLEPASYAFIFKIFCLAWSRRPREYFCSDQMHLAPLGHSSHVDIGGFKIWPPFSPSKLALFTKVGPRNPRAKSEFHLWQSMATNSQNFPALRHLLVYELLFLFLGLEDAQMVILEEIYPRFGRWKWALPPIPQFLVNYEQAPG